MSHTPHKPPPKVSLDELLNASDGLSEALGGSGSRSLSPAELDLLRRSVDLRIDAEGRWWHEGEPFSHPRLIAYFNRQLGWREGEATLTIGERWCYVRCDLTPFLILKIELEEGAEPLWAQLNNGERLPLKGLSLKGDVLFAQLSDTRPARLSRHAQAQCGAWLTEREGGSGYELLFRGRSWPISLDS